MFHIPLRIGTLNPESCDTHARTQGTDQYRCIQSIADQNGSQGTIGTPVSGQNYPFRNFQHKLIDVNKSGQIDYMLIRDIHYIPRLRLLQCFDQSTEVADFKITPGDDASVMITPAQRSGFIRFGSINPTSDTLPGGLLWIGSSGSKTGWVNRLLAGP